MAYQTNLLTTDVPVPVFFNGTGNRPGTLLTHIIRGVQGHIRRKRDLKRLLAQPDYLLRDIGVTREQVIAEFRRSIF